MKKLYKSRSDAKIEGVCGGIAAFIGCDSTIIRLLWALATVFSAAFPGIVLYIVFALIMPDEPDVFDVTDN